MKNTAFSIGLLILSLVDVTAALFAITGTSSPALITFDRDTLSVSSGVPQSLTWTETDIAIDSTSGRIFGLSLNTMLEFDPVGGAVINSNSAPNMNGLAAHNGTLYGISGTSSPSLIAFNADTLSVSMGVPQSSTWTETDIAIDSTSGRIFGLSLNTMLEFDPVSGAVINSNGAPNVNGLAAIPEPSTFTLLLGAGLIWAFGCRRRC